MKRKITFILAIFLLINTMVSCRANHETASCREILTAMTEAELLLPAGRIYSLSAAEGEEEYLPASLLSALYGGNRVTEGWIDCALFLPSVSHPCEFAVVLCRDRDTANDTAALFSARLLLIKQTKTAPRWAGLVDQAEVVIIGNYVLLLISSDSVQALRTAREVMRG